MANTTQRISATHHNPCEELTFPLFRIHTLHERFTGDQAAPTAAAAAGFDGGRGAVVRCQVLQDGKAVDECLEEGVSSSGGWGGSVPKGLFPLHGCLLASLDRRRLHAFKNALGQVFLRLPLGTSPCSKGCATNVSAPVDGRILLVGSSSACQRRSQLSSLPKRCSRSARRLPWHASYDAFMSVVPFSPLRFSLCLRS